MTYALLPISSITPSLTNAARATRYKADAMAELAANIKTTGVRQPIFVRRLPATRLADTFDAAAQGSGPRPEWELIAGQRRWQASQLADLDKIPAMIATDMDNDGDALRFQLVENLQREDLDPIDEAEGYQRLIEATGAPKEDIGAQINKSRRYVYDRLNLLKLCPPVRSALADGTISLSHALLISLIPHDDLQAKALTFASQKSDYNGDTPSVRTFQTWLRQNVTLDLKNATFKITDAALVPAAGDCKQCPKRTGFAPDLFAHIDGADICTDPPCYHSKADAHSAYLQTIADQKGFRLVQGKEAKAIVQVQHNDDLLGYSRLDQIRLDIVDKNGIQKSLRELLGYRGLLRKETCAQLHAVLIEHPVNRGLIEAVDTKLAEAMLIELNYIEPVAAKSTLATQTIAAKKAPDVPGQLTSLVYQAILKQASQHTCAVVDITNTFVLRGLLYLMMESLAMDDQGLHLIFGQDNQIDMADWLGDTTDSQVMADRIIKCMAFLELRDPRTEAQHKSDLRNLLNLLNVDQEQVLHDVKLTIAQQAKAEKKALTPTVQLAQPKPQTGKILKTNTARPPAALRKVKLSAQEAQLGIADAMQSLDGAAALAAGTASVQADAQGFAIGQAVKVTATTDKLRIIAHKYIGKTGTITEAWGNNGYDVTFKGRSGGIASFEASELSAAQQGVK